MTHILTCTDEELFAYEINFTYKGHPIRIKPILDTPKNKLLIKGNNMMLTENDTKPKRELHVLFQMFNGFEVDLGLITQEMAYDKLYLDKFVKLRLESIAALLKSI